MGLFLTRHVCSSRIPPAGRLGVLDRQRDRTLLLQPQLLLHPPKVLRRGRRDFVREESLVVALLARVCRVGGGVLGRVKDVVSASGGAGGLLGAGAWVSSAQAFFVRGLTILGSENGKEEVGTRYAPLVLVS